MSNYKELVLDYFEKWNGKRTNPANGCETMFTSCGMTIVCGDLACSVYMGMDADRVEWPVAARILKLDTPQAAPIKWEVGANGYVNSDCLEYYCKENSIGKWVATLSDHAKVVFDTLEEAKQACQDHKQRQFEQLGGYQ